MSKMKGIIMFMVLSTVAPLALVMLVIGGFALYPLMDGAGPLPWPPTVPNLYAMGPYHRSAGGKVPIAPVREVNHVKNEDGNSTVLAYKLLSTNWSRIGSFTDLDGNKADVEEGRLWTNVCASFFYQNEFYRFIIKSNRGPVIGERRVPTFINATTNTVNPWQWLTNYTPNLVITNLSNYTNSFFNLVPWVATNGITWTDEADRMHIGSNWFGGITVITNLYLSEDPQDRIEWSELKRLVEWWRSCQTNHERFKEGFVPEGKNYILLEDEK